ncbi:hypothetical protein M427DRAFT_35861 [Gonapodya prolifera JEL478]|uniref:Uncharacterized protein n=1 Tax=Gonapodya prolifera (strain JEL478) TaxID=1344416 RepID=A0A139A405_GONPJ|nr:hypothetical protein M427DRAFT_35861 [Gonapodya prolifera JEL478]|eukprot:KXS11318.1 hypothetical protein M427DRAFT_35861 [Gonapodya prolifera JEL478]
MAYRTSPTRSPSGVAHPLRLALAALAALAASHIATADIVLFATWLDSSNCTGPPQYGQLQSVNCNFQGQSPLPVSSSLDAVQCQPLINGTTKQPITVGSYKSACVANQGLTNLTKLFPGVNDTQYFFHDILNSPTCATNLISRTFDIADGRCRPHYSYDTNFTVDTYSPPSESRLRWSYYSKDCKTFYECRDSACTANCTAFNNTNIDKCVPNISPPNDFMDLSQCSTMPAVDANYTANATQSGASTPTPTPAGSGKGNGVVSHRSTVIVFLVAHVMTITALGL